MYVSLALEVNSSKPWVASSSYSYSYMYSFFFFDGFELSWDDKWAAFSWRLMAIINVPVYQLYICLPTLCLVIICHILNNQPSPATTWGDAAASILPPATSHQPPATCHLKAQKPKLKLPWELMQVQWAAVGWKYLSLNRGRSGCSIDNI